MQFSKKTLFSFLVLSIFFLSFSFFLNKIIAATIPILTTEPATNVDGYSATLNGTLVDDGGEDVGQRLFEWGETLAYELGPGFVEICDPFDSNCPEGSYSRNINFLECNTTYHFRSFAVNSAGTGYGNDQEFTTLACPSDPPVLTTEPATDITSGSVTLNGNISDTGGENPSTAGFEYGTTPAYGLTISSAGSFGVGDFSEDVSSLACETTYHFRSFATNTLGTSYGADESFTTEACPDLPTLTTEVATLIGISVATLNGTITDTGGANAFTRGFQYGTTIAYGSIVSTNGDYAIGAYSQNVSSLACETTYHFRSFATNSAGTSYGPDQTFTTLEGCPILTTEPATNITAESVTLNGTLVDDLGSEISQMDFEWGETLAYELGPGGIIILCDPFAGDCVEGPYIKNLNFLVCNTTYHFRSFAVSSVGTGYGNDQTFTTGACPTPPSITTDLATSITKNSVTLNGTITDIGGFNATSRGFELYLPFGSVVYSENDNTGTLTVIEGDVVIIEDPFDPDIPPPPPPPDLPPPPPDPVGFPVGSFSWADTPSLSCGTSYLYRAFASNPYGFTWGNDQIFTTLDCEEGGGILDIVLPPDDEIIGPPNDTTDDDNTDNDDDNNQGGGVVIGTIIPIDTTPPDDEIILSPEEIILPEIENPLPDEENPPRNPVIEDIYEILKTEEGTVATQAVVLTGIVPGVYLMTTVLFAGPIIFDEIILFPVRFWGMLLGALGFRKRKKTVPWGTVYDSVTKQPLDPAYVVLYDSNGKEINTSITDLDGRYGFMVPTGRYKIGVNKTHYLFPSKKLIGRDEDVLYRDLYFGESIEVKEGEIITKNIPMDPVKFDWNEFAKRDQKAMKFFSKRELWFYRLSNFLFFFGFVFSIIAVVVSPISYNIIVSLIYLALILMKFSIFKPKPHGYIKTKRDKTPLAFALIRVFRSDTNQEISHKITDKHGKYYCLVPNGKYYITIEKKISDDSYNLIFTSPSFEIKKGYINKKFEI